MASVLNRREFIKKAIIGSAAVINKGCSTAESMLISERIYNRNNDISQIYELSIDLAKRQNILKSNDYPSIFFPKNHLLLLLYKKDGDSYQMLGCKKVPYPQWDNSMNAFNYAPINESITKFYSDPSIEPNCKIE